MKIMFLYPQWTGKYGLIGSYFARRAGGVIPPLNLGLLAAIARQGGHEVSIIDAEIDRVNEGALVNKVIQEKPDLVALTGMSPFFHLSKSVATSIKEINPDLKILLGGQHFTIEGEKAFHKCFDYAYSGECENQLVPLLEKLENNQTPKEVKGLYYRNKNNDADLTVSNGTVAEVISDITQYHTSDTEDAYPVTIVDYKVWGSIADAKAGIISSTVLAAFDTHCDRQEWALVDNNKGLKMTRDWKIEMDPTAFLSGGCPLGLKVKAVVELPKSVRGTL